MIHLSTRLATALVVVTLAVGSAGCSHTALTQPQEDATAAQSPRVDDQAANGESSADRPAVTRTGRPRLAGQEIVVNSMASAALQGRPGILEVGRRGSLSASGSAGQAQTLREATRAIIPSDYAVRPAACVAQQESASWSRSDNWLNALEQLMVTHGLVATVDHDLKQVLIDKPPALDPNAPRDWAVLRSDATLRQALERWLTPACVQLEWDVPFPLDVRADRVYRGVDLWTALKTLAKELEASDTPIQIIQHPNVVRIASGQLR